MNCARVLFQMFKVTVMSCFALGWASISREDADINNNGTNALRSVCGTESVFCGAKKRARHRALPRHDAPPPVRAPIYNNFSAEPILRTDSTDDPIYYEKNACAIHSQKLASNNYGLAEWVNTCLDGYDAKIMKGCLVVRLRRKGETARSSIPDSKSLCHWSYGRARCEPTNACKYDYKFGDWHLSQSCRPRQKPEAMGTRWYGRESADVATTACMQSKCVCRAVLPCTPTQTQSGVSPQAAEMRIARNAPIIAWNPPKPRIIQHQYSAEDIVTDCGVDC